MRTTSNSRRYYDDDRDASIALCGASFIVGSMMGAVIALMWLS